MEKVTWLPSNLQYPWRWVTMETAITLHFPFSSPWKPTFYFPLLWIWLFYVPHIRKIGYLSTSYTWTVVGDVGEGVPPQPGELWRLRKVIGCSTVSFMDNLLFIQMTSIYNLLYIICISVRPLFPKNGVPRTPGMWGKSRFGIHNSK